jgi:hypothetical protein
LQGSLLQVEISNIIVHEADEPNAFVDLFDAELSAGQHDGDVDLLAVHAETTAGCDDDISIVEGIGQVGKAAAFD